jgi:hypothetical protein
VLTPGIYNIRLVSLSGTVDWGMTLHDAQVPYGGKLPLQLEFISNSAASGQNEYLGVQITTAGNYCLAVWKSGAADLGKAGSYRLEFDGGATGVGDTTPPLSPLISSLRDVHPNPFNPRTTVSFDLARPGAVRIGVYNLRGSLVRTLVAGSRDAGQYDVSWDGIDDAGRSVASGVYLVRLEAAGVADERKIALVK